MSLQLQFNLAGSWRNVLAFDEARLDEVLVAARRLMHAAGYSGASLRVKQDDGEVRLIWAADGCQDWPFRERSA